MQMSLSLAWIVFGFSHLARSHSPSDCIRPTTPLCCQNFGSICQWKSKHKNAKGKNQGLKAKSKTYIATLRLSENVKKKLKKKEEEKKER